MIGVEAVYDGAGGRAAAFRGFGDGNPCKDGVACHIPCLAAVVGRKESGPAAKRFPAGQISFESSLV